MFLLNWKGEERDLEMDRGEVDLFIHLVDVEASCLRDCPSRVEEDQSQWSIGPLSSHSCALQHDDKLDPILYDLVAARKRRRPLRRQAPPLLSRCGVDQQLLHA